MHDFRRLFSLIAAAVCLQIQSCESPFQVKEEYSPQLVLYGIAFRGDSTIVVRVETNSISEEKSLSDVKQIPGLSATLSSSTTGTEIPLTADYIGGRNFLETQIKLTPRSIIKIRATADGYPACTASLTVMDQAVIYPAYWTASVLRLPSTELQDPQFTIYPSANSEAIRLRLHLRYNGVNDKGDSVAGEQLVNPSYQSDTTSYFLKIGGEITNVRFPVSEYMTAYASVRDQIKTGTVTAVVELTQIDAALYRFYSIAHGFNDPLTMQTERPVYTNVSGGLGFFSSVSRDTISIHVYP